MQIEDRNIHLISLQTPSTGAGKVKFVLFLCVLLSLIGSITLTVMPSIGSETPTPPLVSAAENQYTPTFVVPETSPTAVSGTPATTVPETPVTSQPGTTPAPITPFPTVLPSQIATLQAHDRFFYHGNTSLPEMALTFDDGPSPYYTPQILAILQKYGVHGTFFCVGRLVQAYPDIVRQAYNEGNVIGNHSWSHPDLALMSGADISKQLNLTSTIIQNTIGIHPTFFRPPYGALSSQVLLQVNLLGLTTVIWNNDPQDWSRPGTDRILARMLYFAGKGAILLLHDGGGNRSQTVAALPTIIETLQQEGYRFVTLQQMVDDIHKQPEQPVTPVAPVASPTPGHSHHPDTTPILPPTSPRSLRKQM